MSTCVISHFSCVWFFVTLWTVACQVPLSMSFSKQGYWSGLPFPSPGNLPDSGIELVSYNSCIAGRSLTLGHQGKPEWLIWVAISYYTDVTNCINFPRFYNNTVYSVTVLMARSSKLRAGKTILPLKGLGKNCFLPLPNFQWISAVLGIFGM